MEQLPEKAVKAVARIVSDLTDRSGLDGAWDSIEEDLQGEIMSEWVRIIVEEVGP